MIIVKSIEFLLSIYKVFEIENSLNYFHKSLISAVQQANMGSS